MSNQKPVGTSQDIPKILIIDPRQLTQNILNYETKSKIIRLFQIIKKFSEKWFSHLLLLGLLILYAIVGAAIFRAIEGSNEKFLKKPINKMREDIIENLLNERMKYQLPDGRPEYFAPKIPKSWIIKSQQLLNEFQILVNNSCEKGIDTDSEQLKWNFWGSLFFSMTVFTTIGYGDNTPKTNTGKAATMIYAFFGIPILLMVLANFGRLFTKGIKFIFNYLKALYHTRSLKKVRQATQAPTQYMIAAIDAVNKGIAYIPYAPKIPLNKEKNNEVFIEKKDNEGYKTPKFWYKARQPGFKPEMLTPIIFQASPTPPLDSGNKDLNLEDMPEIEINTEFNLPITIAIALLILYLLLGAILFWIWEEWTLFEAFYFVFISMSTIGFGDFIPKHPKIMIGAFIYLIFGLALTSMCINVIQEKLNSTFQKAKLTIGESIGLDVEQLMAQEMPDNREKSEESTNKKDVNQKKETKAKDVNQKKETNKNKDTHQKETKSKAAK